MTFTQLFWERAGTAVNFQLGSDRCVNQITSSEIYADHHLQPPRMTGSCPPFREEDCRAQPHPRDKSLPGTNEQAPSPSPQLPIIHILRHGHTRTHVLGSVCSRCESRCCVVMFSTCSQTQKTSGTWIKIRACCLFF